MYNGKRVLVKDKEVKKTRHLKSKLNINSFDRNCISITLITVAGSLLITGFGLRSMLDDVVLSRGNDTNKEELQDIAFDYFKNYNKIEINGYEELLDFKNYEDSDILKQSIVSDVSSKEISLPFSIGDNYNTEKAQEYKNKYYSYVCDASRKYGLDPDFIMAQCTQEYGKENNVMQITRDIFGNKSLENIKNFDTGEVEDVLIVNHGRDGDKVGINDPKTNIDYGCAIMQQLIYKYNNNVLMALQAYNYGFPTLNKVIKEYADSTGRSVEDVINDTSDIGWMDPEFMFISKDYGDSNYIEKTLQWLNKDKSEMGFKSSNGEDIYISLNEIRKVL
ncbi:MAG: transglycosylase SLT domain-containing protein [Bacilli bacterium]